MPDEGERLTKNNVHLVLNTTLLALHVCGDGLDASSKVGCQSSTLGVHFEGLKDNIVC